MRVTMKLFATLREGRFSVREQDLSEGTAIRDVLALFSIPEQQATLLLVNGRHAELTRTLSEGDVLAIFPPVGGG
jgi:sulfur-carrier protein